MIDNPVIQFTEISKSFSRTKILTDVTVTINGGRIYLLSGENGAGKSTLLKILSGLLTPDRGSVNFGFHSRSIKRSRKELLRYLMYMHQSPYMFSGSVSKNLSIALNPFKISKHRARDINDALHWAMLSRHKEVPAKSLSGGQQQRVALARAWLRQPPFLLLDEPVTNMDAPSALRTLELLQSLKDAGVGIVISSHNHQFFCEHIDQHLVLSDGRLTSVEDLEYSGNVTSIHRDNSAKSNFG